LYIANATLLINEIIMHYLLGLSIDKYTNLTKPNSIINMWGTPIQFIIINKISMVGYILFVTMHLKL